ncbi:hypothetical protein HBA_0466 [Sodalis endosymbiont of Henestaris halophilus]|nr:hypothetical protein HBA_0466 [Sodalis endosymbiont of Henestaris halophilus]
MPSKHIRGKLLLFSIKGDLSFLLDTFRFAAIPYDITSQKLPKPEITDNYSYFSTVINCIINCII